MIVIRKKKPFEYGTPRMNMLFRHQESKAITYELTNYNSKSGKWEISWTIDLIIHNTWYYTRDIVRHLKEGTWIRL